MSWNFENAAPVIGTITEGNAWNGERMLYSNIAMNRIMSYDPNSGLVETFRENTEGNNGLNFDSEGRLQIARFGRLIIANGYFPNGSGKERSNDRVPYKLEWYRALFDRLQKWRRAGYRCHCSSMASCGSESPSSSSSVYPASADFDISSA